MSKSVQTRAASYNAVMAYGGLLSIRHMLERGGDISDQTIRKIMDEMAVNLEGLMGSGRRPAGMYKWVPLGDARSGNMRGRSRQSRKRG